MFQILLVVLAVFIRSSIASLPENKTENVPSLNKDLTKIVGNKFLQYNVNRISDKPGLIFES